MVKSLKDRQGFWFMYFLKPWKMVDPQPSPKDIVLFVPIHVYMYIYIYMDWNGQTNNVPWMQFTD